MTVCFLEEMSPLGMFLCERCCVCVSDAVCFHVPWAYIPPFFLPAMKFFPFHFPNMMGAHFMCAVSAVQAMLFFVSVCLYKTGVSPCNVLLWIHWAILLLHWVTI